MMHEKRPRPSIETLMAADRARLREIEREARRGAKFKDPERLDAALAFGKLYREATSAKRGTRTDFEDRLRVEMAQEGREIEAPQVAKLKLPKAIAYIDPQMRATYRGRSEPHRGMAAYLAAVRVAADLLGRDREAMQIEFLRGLDTWRKAARPEISEEHREAADQLWRMLDALGRKLGRELDMMTTFRRLDLQHMRWHWLEGRVEATEGRWMDQPFSPVHPVCDTWTDVSDQRPFPSVPLIRVPMGYVRGLLSIGRTAVDRPDFEGPKFEPKGRNFLTEEGRLIQYREIRLTLAPLNERESGFCLVSRPQLAWRPEGVRGIQGAKDIACWNGWPNAYLDALFRKHFLALEDGFHPVSFVGEDSLSASRPEFIDQTDWAPDPLDGSGEVTYGADGCVSATRLTPDHLFHWLFQGFDLDDEPAVAAFEDAPPTGLPLFSPLFTAARSIEAALLDGRIAEAISTEAQSISDQVRSIVEDGRQSALTRHQAFLDSLSPQTGAL